MTSKLNYVTSVPLPTMLHDSHAVALSKLSFKLIQPSTRVVQPTQPATNWTAHAYQVIIVTHKEHKMCKVLLRQKSTMQY